MVMMKHSGTSPRREEGLRGCRDEGQGCCLGQDSGLPTPESCHPETDYLYLYPPMLVLQKNLSAKVFSRLQPLPNIEMSVLICLQMNPKIYVIHIQAVLYHLFPQLDINTF